MANRLNAARTVLVLVLCISAAAIIFWRKDYTAQALKLDKTILDILSQRGIGAGSLIYESRERFETGGHLFLKIERHYEVRENFDAEQFLTEISNFVQKAKFGFARSVIERGGDNEIFSASFSYKKRVIYEIKFFKRRRAYSAAPKKAGARLAIVIDDCGYNINNRGTLFEIDSPMTVSILPNLPYSAEMAREAGAHNFEVILHLPLEPHNEGLSLEKWTLMVDMPPQEANGILVKAIEGIPGLKGVSNHMGSKATEDREFMKGIFVELKKRKLYFLDNLVTDESVCRDLAAEMGVPAIARSVFLDNKADENYIEKQVLSAARLAERNGWAVAIGHDRPNTIKVLSETVPRLKEAGFKFVHVSELVK